MADELNNDLNTIEEAGASENSLTPGGGTATGDVKMRTIADIVSKLGTMSDEDLNGFKESIAQIGHEADKVGDVAGKNKKSIEAKPSAASMKGVVKEDLAKMFAGEDGEVPLSEAFIDSATVLFEAAIATRLAVEVEALEEDMNEQLSEAVESTVSEMSTRMDKYLDYFAEEFLEQNKVAIENGLRTELAESFIDGMKEVFLKHNVNIPDADVEVIAGLNEQIESLTEQLNDAKNILIESQTTVDNNEISEIANGLTEGMTELDRDRLLLVTEQIEYTDAEDFRAKVTLVRDKLFAAPTASDSNGLVLEEVQAVSPESLQEDANEEAPIPGVMGKYAAAISRTAR